MSGKIILRIVKIILRIVMLETGLPARAREQRLVGKPVNLAGKWPTDFGTRLQNKPLSCSGHSQGAATISPSLKKNDCLRTGRGEPS